MLVNNYIDSFILFLVYLFSLISISGYGITLDKLFFRQEEKKNYNDIFSLFFLGLPVVLIISLFIYIVIGYTHILNSLVIIFGIIFFLKYFNIRKTTIKSLFIPTVLFMGLLISKAHTDFQYYHFQHLQELVNNKLNFGLGNLALRYGHSSLFSFVQALFYLPVFELKLFHVPGYLIFVSLVSYLFEHKNKINNQENLFLICFVLILLPFQFNRLSEFGYDYIGQFILIYAFINSMIEKNKEKTFTFIMFFIFSICIKITNIFFLPIVLFVFFKNKSFFNFNKKHIIFLTVLLFLIPIISFINTGCIFYGNKNTCFSKEKISWAVPYKHIQEEKEFANLWAKAYFHQSTNKIESKKIYLSKFNWVTNWIDKHFFYKISEFFGRIFLVFFLLYFFCAKRKDSKRSNINSLYYALFGFFSVTFWFLFLPQYRFGFSTILITFYFLLFSLSSSNFLINIKKVNIIFLISLTFFCYKNIYRINTNFKSDGFYNFLQFPWYKLPKRNYKIIYDTNKNIVYFEPDGEQKDIITNGIGLYCWNIPSPCSENKSKIKINKKKFYTVIEEL